ncbi:MAG: hypothetical protein K2K25_04605 [Muribaculaceae bacterium]|nr:hypothetical protein [Muribaculaceae bacterium]
MKTVNVHTTDTPQGYKPSMVAEPQPIYPVSAIAPRYTLDIPGFDNPQ